MNCFVIMPFAADFDDVYNAIKEGVLQVLGESGCRCFRLDDNRPAGRITDRLLEELEKASLCIADLTGLKPNVMWEVGYAMALKCPTILISQSISDLPFDIRDMQAHEYERSRLSKSLVEPLKRMVIDTMSSVQRDTVVEQQRDLVGQLMSEMAELKRMVAGAVEAWKSPTAQKPDNQQHSRALAGLQGAWLNSESGSHMYAELIDGQLIAPYCYRGNGSITGVYYDWRMVGDYWFARYAWLDTPSIYGFAFLKHDSLGHLRGAWWSGRDGQDCPISPPENEGVTATWTRASDSKTPPWAKKFFKTVHVNGLPKALRQPETS